MLTFVLTLSPQAGRRPIVIDRDGDRLIITETTAPSAPAAVDFGSMADGEARPAASFGSPYLVGDVVRTGDTIAATIILPIGFRAPHEARFPQPVTVTADGAVPLPPFSMQPDLEPFLWPTT